MLRRLGRRTLVAACAGLLAGAALASPAFADRRVDAVCDRTAESCEVAVGLEEETGGVPGTPPQPGGGTGSDSTSTGSGGTDGECQYVMVDPSNAPTGLGPRPSDDHVLVARACRGDDAGSMTDFQWIEVADGVVAIDPEVLAAQAVDNLRLPQPKIAASPSDFQLVRLPTWLWLEGDSWTSQSASASVPGLSVTATAEPAEAVWSLGDGTELTCGGAGTPWKRGADPVAASPDCGHTYERSSAHAAGGEYEVSVTVVWSVTWSGGGESGSVPGMTTQARTSWPVAESQGLVK